MHATPQLYLMVTRQKYRCGLRLVKIVTRQVRIHMVHCEDQHYWICTTKCLHVLNEITRETWVELKGSIYFIISNIVSRNTRSKNSVSRNIVTKQYPDNKIVICTMYIICYYSFPNFHTDNQKQRHICFCHNLYRWDLHLICIFLNSVDITRYFVCYYIALSLLCQCSDLLYN